MKRLIVISLCLMMLAASVTAQAYSLNPSIKYTNAGTYNLWTEEAYYSSPAVCDIDGDGAYEIIINSLNSAICVYDV